MSRCSPLSFSRPLRRSDGTRPGTFEIFPRDTGVTADGPEQGAVTVAGDHLYFLGCAPACSLWTSDGTIAGTRAVPAANGHPLFLLSSGFLRSRLWTAVGGKTVALTTAPVFGDLFAGAGRVYFLTDDGVHGFEPWVSDGTAAGTHLLKDICRGSLPVAQTRQPSLPDLLSRAGGSSACARSPQRSPARGLFGAAPVGALGPSRLLSILASRWDL
ncbi:MAG TPA: hypothetical protein VGK45_06215 [Thermoanaerobaculia bacterium]